MTRTVGGGGEDRGGEKGTRGDVHMCMYLRETHLETLRFRSLHRHAKVQPVSGIVHHQDHAAERATRGANSLQHCCRRRRRKYAATNRGREHPLPNIAGKGGLVTASPTRYYRHLPKRDQIRGTYCLLSTVDGYPKTEACARLR